MKYTYLLAVLLVIVSCKTTTTTDSNTPDSNTDWHKLNLKGNVKAIKEIKFLAVDNFSEIQNGEKVKHIYNKEYLFNLDGYKIEQNDYVPDGTLANRIMYLHQDNKLVEYNEYDSQGMLFGTGKYELDADGFPKKLNYKTNDGRYNWSETYVYNQHHKVAEVNHFNAESVLESKEVYKYDENGLLTESELYKDKKLITKNTYMNDKGGSNTELQYSGDSSVYTYIYNFDNKGNWIKKIVFENNNPSGILIREIEYFN
ncbi:MAG: hypothetical protein KDD41_05880 [Flavobacteriales bacterium]|nr:hypothetical protein [Flavobacteriales bacterium]